LDPIPQWLKPLEFTVIARGTAEAVPFQSTQISAVSAEIGVNEEVKENYATQK